jgi:molecular chaperone GrpE (heat shock protein)
VRDDVRSGADKQAREQLERNDEVAASAAPQGDGVPDETIADTNDASAMETPEEEDADVDAAQAAEEAERSISELRDKYLRLAAEFDNYRKRTARERAEAGSRAQGELVKHITDSLDDLARVTAVDAASTDARSVIEGVDLVSKKLLKGSPRPVSRSSIPSTRRSIPHSTKPWPPSRRCRRRTITWCRRCSSQATGSAVSSCAQRAWS